ncbi:MAG: hypothetical protein ABIF01_01560 [Candidatus Micrarchaeota archaeon]
MTAMTGMKTPDVLVKDSNGRFRKPTGLEARTATDFFEKMMGNPRIAEGEIFRSLGPREPLYRQNGDGKFHNASERDAAKGKAFRYVHDAVMPRMDEVSATEFQRNRWRYDVVLSETGGVVGAAQQLLDKATERAGKSGAGDTNTVRLTVKVPASGASK